MEYLYFIPTGLVLIIVVLLIVRLSIKRKEKNLLQALEKLGKLTPSHHKAYDYDFYIKDQIFKLKVLYLGHYKELSINSKQHWQLKPSNKIKLIPTQGFDTLDEPKMLIVYPHPTKMVKYINENEIVFIKPNEKCFDFYIYTDQQLTYIEKL
ncbi:MAG: hypothetical protein WC939_04055 [Acholeplasmataceae bacterium]